MAKSCIASEIKQGTLVSNTQQFFHTPFLLNSLGEMVKNILALFHTTESDLQPCNWCKQILEEDHWLLTALWTDSQTENSAKKLHKSNEAF